MRLKLYLEVYVISSSLMVDLSIDCNNFNAFYLKSLVADSGEVKVF